MNPVWSGEVIWGKNLSNLRANTLAKILTSTFSSEWHTAVRNVLSWVFCFVNSPVVSGHLPFLLCHRSDVSPNPWLFPLVLFSMVYILSLSSPVSLPEYFVVSWISSLSQPCYSLALFLISIALLVFLFPCVPLKKRGFDLVNVFSQLWTFFF